MGPRTGARGARPPDSASPFASSPMLEHANALLILGAVLVAGVAGGFLARRVGLPTVTGQILMGILLGRSVLGVFSDEALEQLQPVTHFALGLMAVAVGSHLIVARLKNAKTRLLLLVAFEATLTPAIVFGLILLAPDTSWQFAALVAAISVSTAPAAVLAIVKETRSRGMFVKTLVAGVALNNIACISLFEIAHTAAQLSLGPEGTRSSLDLLVDPLRMVVYSAALGGGIGVLLVLATRRMMRSERLATASMIAILGTAGLAEHLSQRGVEGFSTLLSCLFLGVTLANLTPDKEELGHGVFENFESAIFAVFFTLAGLELDFAYVVPGAALALVMFAGRLGGKTLAAALAMRLAGATDRVRRYLGLALLPQAGLAVGLMLLVTEDRAFPEAFRDLFLAVILTVVTANEIVGPIATRFALGRSGDYKKDRPRLIDFLHEEHIVTDLEAATIEEAVEQLADRLIRANQLKVERDELVAGVLARDREASCCLGNGLAVPNGRLSGGDRIYGAMGISSAGLPFDTPDGQPVHCVLLLATPKSQRSRHLEVLAAFTRAISSDPGIQQQLYHCHSPAHAYELLHADKQTEDFNRFLED